MKQRYRLGGKHPTLPLFTRATNLSHICDVHVSGRLLWVGRDVAAQRFARNIGTGTRKQDHRRWRYHRRLLDYESPFFQLKFPLDHQIPGIIKCLGSSNSFESLKSLLSFEMTLRPSDHEIFNLKIL